MNLAGRLGRLGSFANGPGTALILSGRQEGNQAKEVIAFGNQPVQTALSNAQFLQEHLLFFLIHLRDVLFNLGRNHQNLRVFRIRDFPDFRNSRQFRLRFPQILFLDVAGINDRLCCQQEPLSGDFLLPLIHFTGPCRLQIIQVRQQLCPQRGLLLCPLLTAFQQFRRFLCPFGHRLPVSRNQFQVNRFNIMSGIRAVRMTDNILILKTPDDMDNGLALTNMGQELVSKTLPAARSLNQSGDIDKLDHGRRLLFRRVHLCQPIQPLIRDRDDTRIGFNCAERIICRLRTCFCNGIKQCRFPDVRQSHDT